jgi:putative inorganic carbon (HCO3(-)) transporter
MNSLVSEFLSGVRGNPLYKLIAGRVGFLSLCLIVILVPLVPVNVTAVLILAAGLLFLARGKLTGITALPLFKQIVVFWLVLVLCSLFSLVRLQSLEVTLLYGVFILFYFMCLLEVRHSHSLYLLVGVFLASVAGQAGVGLYQHFISKPLFAGAGLVRVFGTLDNPNILSQYLVPGIIFGIGLCLQERRFYLRFLYLLFVVASIASLSYTLSRGGELALLVVISFFLAIYNWRWFMIAALLGIIGVTLKPSLISSRLASITDFSDTSISTRFVVWAIALEIIRDFWFSGVGVGTAAFQAIYSRYNSLYGFVAMHAHNFFLELLVEIGVFGTLIFLWFLLSYFVRGLRSLGQMPWGINKTIALASISAMVGYLVQGLTDTPWYNFRMVFLFWFLMAITMAATRLGRPEKVD